MSPLGFEFDNFLFASIGEDRNGMMLSIISMLARLDVDPWQEAAELAQLPGDAATQRLALLIAALPDKPLMNLDARALATRLIALLPRKHVSDVPDVPPGETFLGISAVTDLRGLTYAIVIFFVVVLGAQWIIANHQPPLQIDAASRPASVAFIPLVPPPNYGQ